MSKKIHCDVCDVQLGSPPYATVWNTIVSENIKLDLCRDCNPKIELGIKAILHNRREEVQKKVEVESNG